METAVSLKEWLDNHYITYSLRKDVLVIPGFGRCLIQSDYDHIFKERKTKDGKDTEVVFNSQENLAFLKEDDIPYIVFPFGKRWYYVCIDDDPKEMQFNELRYVGESPKFEHDSSEYYPLGIHTGFELLNGSGSLKNWCKKSKFLGYAGLGIADKNTMAATLALQTTATGMDLKYCFGYSVTIQIDDEKVNGIVYCNTQKGFRNLLRLQKAVAVDNVDTKVITPLELLNRAEGNVFVFEKRMGGWMVEHQDKLQDFIKAFDGWVYFQVDCTEYKADRIDSAVLLSIKAYYDNFYLGNLEYKHNVRPILIQDAYYLDKEDWRTKIVLNKIDNGAAHEQSDQQYMKTIDELYADWRRIFSERFDDEVFYDMVRATADIVENAEAAYDLNCNYAPQYDMTPEEKKKYGTTHNMFLQLIEEGFKKLVPEGEEEKYRERIEYEKYVVESTDNVDYFLIQREEINWAKEHGILTGIGRGSAGGALILYLLGITFIDPLKYGLLFERFLLPERAGLEPADVTKICEDIDSSDYIEIKLENGKTYKFDKDAQFLVKRGDETLSVYADELQEEDDIVFDQKNLLFDL